MGQHLYKFLTILVLINTIEFSTASCKGCLELDEITFEKMISKFQYSLVKFDIAFPYGEKHELYGSFAKKYAMKIENLMFSLVGVKDYGDKDNSEIAKRYDVDEKKYPVILLFRNYSTDNYVKYPTDLELTVDNLGKFVRDNSDIYIGLDGCLKEFDQLTLDFNQLSVDKQKEVLETAKKLAEDVKHPEDKTNANLYIGVMSRIIEKGGSFVDEEKRRISNLLKGKIHDKKRKELTNKVNILDSFKRTTGSQKDEL